MQIEVNAQKRSKQGTGASRRLRREGKTPGIVYGGKQPAVVIELDHNALLPPAAPGGIPRFRADAESRRREGAGTVARGQHAPVQAARSSTSTSSAFWPT